MELQSDFGVDIAMALDVCPPFPAAKDRSFSLVHNTIAIRTADENRFMRISRAATAPFKKRPLQCAVRYKKFEIIRVPRFSRRTNASGAPAETRRIVGNGTVTIGGIALSAARSKLQCHERAVRVVHVIGERFAIGESTSGVEPASWLKSSL